MLLVFILYADTLLSINQIAPLLGRAYKNVLEQYMRLHAERMSQGGGADCQLALKSGLLPVDAVAVFAVAWEPSDAKVTDKPLPQQSEQITVSD